MARPDDLASLLITGKSEGVGFRQGTVLAYNPLTGENTILVGGGIVTNLPILNTSEALLLEAQSVVGILTAGPSWFILGRITVPNTPQALTALNAIRIASANVPDFDNTASTTFVDLATPGPSVDLFVGPTGRCLVLLTTAIQESLTTTPRGGIMGVAVSGATTRPASFNRILQIGHSDDQYNNLWCRTTAAVMEEGLTPGWHTFTAKYASNDSGLVDFYDRNLTAIAL